MAIPTKTFIENVNNQDWTFTQGHRLCPGCNAPLVPKWTTMVAQALGYDLVVGSATGCLEVSSTIFPFSSWNTPFIHSAFENVAATMTGAETAYRALQQRGKFKHDKPVKFVAFGGDGGTYDIGLQSLSGAVERGHNFLYITYDNEGYMNTGNQRSGATPQGAETTTEPLGKAKPGKLQLKKNIAEIMAGHENVYVATATTGNYMDFMNKVEKAMKFEGPSFITILAPCVRFWRLNDDSGVETAKLASDSKYWPLYEYFRGRYNVTYKPREFRPVKEYIEKIPRFRVFLKKQESEQILDELQYYVDTKWDRLLKLEEATKDIQLMR